MDVPQETEHERQNSDIFGFHVTLPDGTTKVVSQQEIIAAILGQFYNTVQVMNGEATSVSELRAFLQEKENELR
jgi:hypothetical protein